jgi:hypothetical protein
MLTAFVLAHGENAGGRFAIGCRAVLTRWRRRRNRTKWNSFDFI